MLQQLHEPAVVDGLVGKLGSVQQPEIRGPVLTALCRLYYKEADWDGKWWGTRPDTSGPYFKPAEWEATPKVKQALVAAIGSEKPEVLRGLLTDLPRHKIVLAEASGAIAKAAATDPAFKAGAVDAAAGKSQLSADNVTLLKGVATDEKAPAALRAKAIGALTKSGGPAGLDAAVDALTPVLSAEKPNPELAAALDEFVHDTKHGQNVAYFTKLAASDSAPKRELAYSVLVSLADSKLAKADTKAAAAKVIESGWEKPATAAPLLRAIGRTKTSGYKDWIEAMQSDPSPEVIKAAAFASAQLNIKNTGPAAETREPIEKVGFEKTVDLVKKEKGDALLGQQLFTKQGCIACHTTSPDQPPKGPMLGGIALRYSRAELCESIMKPSAKIAQGFETQWFKTKDGEMQEGFVTKESGDEVELRNVAGVALTIKKTDVEKRGKRDTSIMPEGLVTKLTPSDLASIIAYLESLKAK